MWVRFALLIAALDACAPLPAKDGATTSIAALARGKVAVVSFWASWCDTCVAELGAIDRLDARLRERGGVVIAVDVGEPRAEAAEFARAHGLRCAQLFDADLKLADALGQSRVPATLVLDRHGRVIYTGASLDEGALAAVRSALDAPE